MCNVLQCTPILYRHSMCSHLYWTRENIEALPLVILGPMNTRDTNTVSSTNEADAFRVWRTSEPLLVKRLVQELSWFERGTTNSKHHHLSSCNPWTPEMPTPFQRWAVGGIVVGGFWGGEVAELANDLGCWHGEGWLWDMGSVMGGGFWGGRCLWNETSQCQWKK